MPRTKAAERLEIYRASLVSTTGKRSILTDGNNLHLQIPGMTGDYETICTITTACPVSERDILLNCFEREADLIGMIDATRRYLPKLLAKKDSEIASLRRDLEAMGGRPAKNYAAQCAMKCSEPAFKAFIEARHALARPLTDERVAARVRSVLAISSRTELNTSSEAAARWRTMVVDFDTWRKR